MNNNAAKHAAITLKRLLIRLTFIYLKTWFKSLKVILKSDAGKKVVKLVAGKLNGM